MFRKIGHASVVAALVMMLGGHWAILQAVAWSNMLAENLRAASVSAAVGKTFDGRHPCRLCKAIAQGKQTQKKDEAFVQLKKMEFISDRVSFVFSAPQAFSVLPECQFSTIHSFQKPPVPPPRIPLA